MLSFGRQPVTSWAIASRAAALLSGGAGVAATRQVERFDSDWRFHAGEAKGAERPDYDDSAWLRVDVPHDWSIEGLAHSEADVAAPKVEISVGGGQPLADTPHVQGTL